MKWQKKNKYRIWGQRKTKKFFALFPVTIGDERRWLETVKVLYKWDYYYGADGQIDFKWKRIKFMTK